jgi:hypothetical protein
MKIKYINVTHFISFATLHVKNQLEHHDTNISIISHQDNKDVIPSQPTLQG